MLALLMAEDSEAGSNLCSSIEPLPRLCDIFFVGQYVRCVVQSLTQSGAMHHIGLSLHVSAVNDTLMPSDVREGMLLAACVKTVEDHGYTLTFGIKASIAEGWTNQLVDSLHEEQNMCLATCDGGGRTATFLQFVLFPSNNVSCRERLLRSFSNSLHL